MNEKILTFSAPERVYKVCGVWRGTACFTKIDGVDVDELKVSEARIDCIQAEAESRTTQAPRDRNWRVLFTYKHLLHRQRQLTLSSSVRAKSS